MPSLHDRTGFLRHPVALAATILLVLQFGFFASLPKQETIPLTRPLNEFPAQVAGWRLVSDIPLEQEILDLLKADETLNRYYVAPGWPAGASLFVAYFRSQRAGTSPHSPKVCLPGSGWTPSASEEVRLAVPGRSEPIPVNRYVVSKGENRSIVLYFYQSNGRAIANEYQAKLYSMFASIRYRRSDAALVRVVVAVPDNNEEKARQTAASFLASVYPEVQRHLPR